MKQLWGFLYTVFPRIEAGASISKVKFSDQASNQDQAYIGNTKSYEP